MAVGNDGQAAVAPQKAETLVNGFAEYVPKMRRFLDEGIAADGALVEPGLGPSWLERESEVVASLLALREPAYAAVRQAEVSYGRLSLAASGPDPWDESRELRCQLCFVGWRHSLALGRLDLAGQWWTRFQQTFQVPWVGFDAYGGYVDELENAEFRGVLIDSCSLLSLSSWMRVELGRREKSLRHLLPRLRGLIRSVDLGEISLEERFAIETEFGLLDAICQRMGGKATLAMSIVLAIERHPLSDRLTLQAKYDCEAEKIACLFELLECEAVVVRARAFLQASHEESTSLAQAKVALSLGVSLSLMGQYREAAAVLGKAVADPWIVASPLFAIAVRQTLGVALMQSGCVVAGLGQLRRAGRLARSFRDCVPGAMFDFYAAEGLKAVGQYEESATILKAALSRLESTGHDRWAAYGRLLYAEVLVGLCRHAEARQALLVAVDQLRSFEARIELRAAMQLLREVERVIGQSDVSRARRSGDPS